MIFSTLEQVARKYPNNLALNSYTYSKLIQAIHDRPYVSVTYGNNVSILLDILKAASLDKPIVVLPRSRNYTVPSLDSGFKIVLWSSGSTSGEQKSVTIPEKVLYQNAINSINCHNLTSSDRILTVCRMNHTGGINAQTIPGLLAGAQVVVQEFNAFNYLRLINEHSITISHLVPAMINGLIMVGSSIAVPSLRLIMCGSDCVLENHVRWWLDKNVPLIVNYGMSEAGPITINHCFNTVDELDIYRLGIPLGTKTWCDAKIVDGELYLRGDNVVTSDWLKTDDCVELVDGWYIYRGRKSAGCKIIPKSY